MSIMKFGHKSFVTWTEAELRKERQAMENDYDYECITCGHRITVPLGQKTPPRKCEECGDTWCYLSKDQIEENELIDAIEERQWPKDE